MALSTAVLVGEANDWIKDVADKASKLKELESGCKCEHVQNTAKYLRENANFPTLS